MMVLNFKVTFLIDREVKKQCNICVSKKTLDSKGDTNKTIVQHNNNDSNTTKISILQMKLCHLF